MANSYEYSKSADLDGKLNPDLLRLELLDSVELASTFEAITTVGDVVSIWFSVPLDAAGQTALDNVVQAHTGNHGMEFFLGSASGGSDAKMLYQFLSVVVADEVQYTRVLVKPGTYTRMRLFLNSGGVSGATIRAAVHGDSRMSGTFVPGTIIISGQYNLVIDDDGKSVYVDFTTPLVVTSETHFWLSFLCRSAIPQWASTDNLLGGFQDVYYQQTLDGVIPTNPVPETYDATAIYVALVE